MAKLLTIAAGGTGGHMFPAQALAEEMLSRGWRVKLSTDPRGARYTGGFPESVEIEVVQAATFARGGIMAKLKAPIQILSGILFARRSMKADRPALVAGFGGYPALPAMMAAGALKIPRVLHEQNGVLGRVNQFFARKVDHVACGTWPTELPDGVEGLDIGNPVRGAVRERAAADYIAPGDWPMEVLVIGGSQGSSIVAQMAADAMAHIPTKLRKHLRIACQAREADQAEVAAAFEAADVPATIEPFFTDLPARMAECQLVISRSGASSVADISIIGRPSILVPLAIAIRGEQHANARGLVDAGAATMIEEADLTPESLAGAIAHILSSANRASKMARAALTLGKPDAAERLADLVEQTAE